MEKLADKHNVREQFVKIVDEFTSLLSDFNGMKINYLIICIDDIDMTQNKHMDIMQCIHQYFMIPGVIVFVSFNIPMLTATLQADFYSHVSIDNSRDEEHNHQMDMTLNQTYDFMRKIIPADMRINMPSWKKMITENFFLLILILKINECEFYKKIQKNNEKLITPKELIMLILADRTSIYLDICGFKLHFMQPNSLRELSDLFYLIYNMKSYNTEKEDTVKAIKDENCQKRRENRKILLDYLHFKMLPENNFSMGISNFIGDFLSSPMERRGRIIWNYYFKLLNNDENRNRIQKIYGEDFYNLELERIEIEKYSMGSLYRVLYSATRLNILDRKVVIFLLASFSFSMPQFVEGEKKTKLEKEAGNTGAEIYNCKRLREAFRYSLIGTWCENLFGRKNVILSIDLKKFKEKVIKNNITNLVYVFMLSSCSTRKPLEILVNNEFHEFNIKIDPTAFIINSYAFDHRMSKTIFKLSDSEPKNIIEYIKQITDNDIKYQSENAESLYDEIKSVLNNSNHVPAFLLKNIDLSYNVIKRVISEMVYSSDNNVSSIKDPAIKNPFDIIKDLYKRIIKKLEEQDEKYLHDMDNKSSFNMLFSSNPVVSLFINNNNNILEDIGVKLKFEQVEEKNNDRQAQA